MSHESSTGGSSNNSYFDSSFDYRSLLPQGMMGGGGGNNSSNNNNFQQQQQQQQNEIDIEGSSGGIGSFFSGRSISSTTTTNSNATTNVLSGCTEIYGAWIPEMTWRERLIGCSTCMIAGYLLSLGSFFRIRDLLFGNPIPLVMNATIGNLIALAGSCFLSGPSNQLNRMWATKRRYATILYLGSLVITLLVVILPLPGPKGFILLLLMLSQYVSITWYCLSYIPMGQEMAASFCRRYININSSSGDVEF
jgi:Got1/Sft2-like family